MVFTKLLLNNSHNTMSGNQSVTGAFMSVIEQSGNYFIIDTEQVISTPYQDLQSSASDNTKKITFTERLTTVRNNVCEHNLRTETSDLEKERMRTLHNLHMDTRNLRHQVKVMDINKRKNELMMEEWIDPMKDFSYDKRQINNSAKKLGITTEESFYLVKKLKYPLRTNIKMDRNEKPIIRKARRSLIDHILKTKTDQYDMDHAQILQANERAFTAHTVSTFADITSPEPSMKEQTSSTPVHRQVSKSASTFKSFKNEPGNSMSRQDDTDQINAILPSISRQSKSHVKFQMKQPQSKQLDTFSKAKTYYTGLKYPSRNYKESWDSDSDDERVDLWTLFFSDKSQRSDSKSAVSGNTTPRTLPTRMSSDIPIQLRPSVGKSKFNEETLKKESKAIREKVDKFFKTMSMDGTLEKDIKEEVKKKQEMTAYEKNTVVKAAMLQNVFAKPLDQSKARWHTSEEMQSKSNAEDNETTQVKIEQSKSADEDRSEKVKHLWDVIYTNVRNGTLHTKYTSNDLLLQQLTGILVQTEKKCVIPVHAASRALRHTPTFKMRRVVEELTRQRTRHEQQEVDKLHKQGGTMYHEDSGHRETHIQHYVPHARATPT